MHEFARGWGTELEYLTDWLVIRLYAFGNDRENEPALADALFGIAEAQHRFRVIVEPDLSVDFRSYLVGQFITLHKRLHLRGGALRLSGVSAGNYDVLRLMRLTDHIPAFPDRHAALHA
jgi:hypothetical protein